MENLKDLKVLVFGLGSYKDGSGVAAGKFFLAQGAEVRVTDLKTEQELSHQIKALKKIAKKGDLKFILGQHKNEDILWADLIIQNPGIPDNSPYLKLAREKNKTITNDVAYFLENCTNPVLGVTGTRGKSTTTALLYEMIKKEFPNAQLGGNIGVSPLTFINKLKHGDPVVLELSSWLLHHVKKGPAIAVVTNILKDHLNRYSSIEEYATDKARILQGPGLAVLGWDNQYTRSMGQKMRDRQVIWFSIKTKPPGQSVYIKKDQIMIGTKVLAKVTDVKLLGSHNLVNVLAATTAAWQFGISLAQIKKAIQGFTGLPNRLELVRVVNGIKWYNDTTATSPDAVVAALSALSRKKRIILIAGGTDKQLDFQDLAKAIKHEVDEIILFTGTATQKLIFLLPKNSYHLVSSMKQAIQLALSLAEKGDIVLLSPGAASFGIFKNEFDRGEQFIKEVKRLSSRA